jgi:hypothetical protein
MMNTLSSNIIRSDRESIQGLFHRIGPEHPLVHWIRLLWFLYSTSYFEYVYLIISVRVTFCTSFASFNTSRSRFPTETQLKRAIMKIVGAGTSGGASDTKQPSLLLLDKKAHVFERAWIVAKKGDKTSHFWGKYAPEKNVPPILAPILAP